MCVIILEPHSLIIKRSVSCQTIAPQKIRPIVIEDQPFVDYKFL